MKLRVRDIKRFIEVIEEIELAYYHKDITLAKEDDEVIKGYIYRISDILEKMGLKRFITKKPKNDNELIKAKYKEIKPQIKKLQKEIKSLISYLELIITKYQSKDIKECYGNFVKKLKEVLEIYISAFYSYSEDLKRL